MGKFVDLTGRKFNKLTVIGLLDRGNPRPRYVCKCDCGNECVSVAATLKSGHVRSCGCLQREIASIRRSDDLTGQRFGRWIVIEQSYDIPPKYCKCQCDCGNIKLVRRDGLLNGASQSCGCLHREILSETEDLSGKIFGRLTVLGRSDKRHGDKKIKWRCLCECGNIRNVWSISLKHGITKSCGCYNREKGFTVSGEKNYRWRGGRSNDPYPREWTLELKRTIRNRDDHKCQYPDCEYDDTKEKMKLHVHHIDGNKKNCENDNLISLCKSHHMKIESTSARNWEYYFHQIINDYNQETICLE